MNKTDFYFQAEAFLKHLFAQLKIHEVELQPHWSIDHLCFRTQSLESYEHHKKNFISFGDLLIESQVSGRMIATYKLHEAMKFQGYTINIIELPAPKFGKVTIEGFEHAEVVIDLPFETLCKKLTRCHLDESGLKKVFNQELEIEMQGCALKFHLLSLESVITLEKNQKVHHALMASRVLEILKAYRPVVAGTFPLGLEIAGSDLDILLTSSNLLALEKIIQTSFQGLEKFESYFTAKSGLETLIARFSFGDVPFELFAQSIESLQQDAYKHFQVEERLLKLGDQSLRKTVGLLRDQGLKTEPAFAKALNLSGDPYAELLRLHALAERELRLILGD